MTDDELKALGFDDRMRQADSDTLLRQVTIMIRQQRFQLGLIYLNLARERFGETPRWKALLKQFRFSKSASSRLRRLAAEPAPVPGPLADLPDGLFATQAGDILVERRKASRSLVLVFKGLRSGGGGVLPDNLEWLTDLGPNVMYFADPNGVLNLAGVPSLAGDYAGTLRAIASLCEAWGVLRLYTLGYSAGGYSAIRYGVDLGATRVLTFAAPTSLTREVQATDRRAAQLLDRVHETVPEMGVELRPLVAARPDVPVINWFGDSMPEDGFHARKLDGLPNVSLLSYPALDGHDVPRALKRAGRYGETLESFLRDRA